jgi:hypothetical protein
MQTGNKHEVRGKQCRKTTAWLTHGIYYRRGLYVVWLSRIAVEGLPVNRREATALAESSA